jgi:hypothetical protein
LAAMTCSASILGLKPGRRRCAARPRRPVADDGERKQTYHPKIRKKR